MSKPEQETRFKFKCKRCGSTCLIPEKVIDNVGCLSCLFCGRNANDYVIIPKGRKAKHEKAQKDMV